MDRIRTLFFSLLRSALGTGRAGGRVELSSREWRRLSGMAFSQNLATVIFEELSRRGCNIPPELSGPWKEYAGFCHSKFDAQLMALTHLSQVLSESGISTMVLKGVGLSLLYPCPQSRECSDVDIWCFGEYSRVNELLLAGGYISGLDEENDKHCSFTFDGICIENHRFFSEYVNRANVALGEEILRLSAGSPLTDSRLPGLLFPNPEMGVHFLMMHTLSHMAWSGISVRHLVDCGLYLQNCAGAFDRERVLSVWKDAGIADAALSICSICEESLGLQTGMLPHCGWKPDPRVTSHILKGVFLPLEGSSGVSDPLRKFLRKARQFRYRSAMHPIVYGEPFPDSFWKAFAILRHGNGQV